MAQRESTYYQVNFDFEEQKTDDKVIPITFDNLEMVEKFQAIIQESLSSITELENQPAIMRVYKIHENFKIALTREVKIQGTPQTIEQAIEWWIKNRPNDPTSDMQPTKYESREAGSLWDFMTRPAKTVNTVTNEQEPQ